MGELVLVPLRVEKAITVSWFAILAPLWVFALFVIVYTIYIGGNDCAFNTVGRVQLSTSQRVGMYSYLFGLFAFLTSMCLGAARLDGSVTSAWWVILAPMFGAMVIFSVVIMHTACTYGLEMVSVADDPTQAGTETHREDGYDTWPLLGKVKVKRIQHDVFLGNCRGQRE